MNENDRDPDRPWDVSAAAAGMADAIARGPIDMTCGATALGGPCALTRNHRGKHTPAPDDRPHSRACGPFCRGHGTACHPNCPTCGGRPEPAPMAVPEGPGRWIPQPQLDGLYANRERLELARTALVETGYFTADEVGNDVAPRITELHARTVGDTLDALRAECARLADDNRQLRLLLEPAPVPGDVAILDAYAVPLGRCSTCSNTVIDTSWAGDKPSWHHATGGAYTHSPTNVTVLRTGTKPSRDPSPAAEPPPTEPPSVPAYALDLSLARQLYSLLDTAHHEGLL